jgi:DNA-directed RNA polymerase beta' subunit
MACVLSNEKNGKMIPKKKEESVMAKNEQTSKEIGSIAAGDTTRSEGPNAIQTDRWLSAYPEARSAEVVEIRQRKSAFFSFSSCFI